MEKEIKSIFWGMIIIFVLIISYFFIPGLDSIRREAFIFVAILGFILLILGIILIYRTIKLKKKGKEKLFFILTGISPAGMVLGSILHNFFYALGIIFEDNILLNKFFEILHVTSFLLSLIVFPVLFIIGAIGIILIERKK